jgi:hypothetical protein
MRRNPRELVQAAPDRAPRNTADLRHRRDAATTGGTGFGGGEQTKRALVEMCRDHLVAHTYSVDVNHAYSI